MTRRSHNNERMERVMFGEIQSLANLAKYPLVEAPPEAAAPARRHNARIPEVGSLEHFGSLFGACAPMRKMFRKIERLARSNAPVIVLGESGAGKELVANTLHKLSARAAAPFIAINCGALAENLIESELFGHERGSFTGALRTHRGCFERADGGTLFLDEITEMPLEMQVRLLRVLESGKFCRVGGDQELSTDVRVLAATNRDLQQAVASGRLREDLMYRLCVIPVTVPPLRERGEDAVLLAQMFLSALNEEHGESKHLSEHATRCIRDYRWPGNVRELKNVIHRAFVLSDSEVEVDIDASTSGESVESSVAALRSPAATASSIGEVFAVRIPVGMSLDDAEQTLIKATLDSVNGSKVKAAQVLGISLKTLYNRLHAYDDVARKAGSPPVCSAIAARGSPLS
ncbi:MAG: sigma-54 dependent transcriptional regulator [Betaproteobacteria bacterium]